MATSAELAKRIQVIHREPGFLRLELPAELCGEAATSALEHGMRGLEGLHSAAVDRGWQRISLRYDATVLSTAQVARWLFSLLDGLLDNLPLTENTATTMATPATAQAESFRSGPLGE